MLLLGLGGFFFLARLGGRSILDLRISLFGLGFCLLCLGLSNILGLRISLFSLGLYLLCLDLSGICSLWGGLSLLAITLVFGPINPLALITNLAGSLGNLRERESSLDSQGLLWGLRSNGKGRWKGNWDFTDLRVLVYLHWLPPLQVCRNSYKVVGFCPCYIALSHAYLD